MKIAVWHNLPSGGGKRALYDHIRGLKARGHEIEAWCPPTADRSYLPLTDLVPEHVVELDWPGQRTWGDVIRLGYGMERMLREMDEHCRRCAAEIDRGGFDLLFANACQFFRTTAIGRLSALPSAIYLGEPYRWLYEAMPKLCWIAPPTSPPRPLSPDWWQARIRDRRRIWGWRLQVREEARNAAAFDAILVNSRFSRESILRAYGLDAAVCYLGTDTARLVDRGVPRENFVVGLGAFTPEKNLELPIRALALLPEPRPRLLWIGNLSDPAYLAEMTALAASLGVVFEPQQRLDDGAIADLLNRAMAMVYAPRLEPFGLAPIEAAACGLPVVAVAEGGVRESVVDGVTGLMAENDPRSFADALARLIGDPGLRDRLGKAARSGAECNWSLDACTDRIEKRLAAVAASQSHPERNAHAM